MKRLGLVAVLLVFCLAAGCGKTTDGAKRTNNAIKSVNDVLAEEMAKEDSKAGNSEVQDKTESQVASNEQDTEQNAEQNELCSNGSSPIAELTPGDTVDVDLTALSSTLVYSEVYNMMVAPDDYIGKTVRMAGPFSYFHDPNTDKYYFACIIQDATACCAQGLEFVPEDERKFPDDYPEVGGPIQVAGTFDTYYEYDAEGRAMRYCTLLNAIFEPVSEKNTEESASSENS